MNDLSLTAYIDRMLAEHEKRWLVLFSEHEKRWLAGFESHADRVNYAFIAAEKAADRSVAVSNEFRGQLADQASTFLRKEEAQARLNSIEARIDVIASRLDKTEGRSGGVGAVGGILLSILALLIAAAAVAVAVWK